MSHKYLLGLILLFATSCHALDNPSKGKLIACSYSLKRPMTSGEAKVSIEDSIVNRISFNNYFPGGRGELGYTCNIDLKRGDSAYSWQDNGSGFIVTAKENGESIVLNRTKTGYLLNFANLKSLSKYCGIGAEIPESLLIPFSAKSCKAGAPH